MSKCLVVGGGNFVGASIVRRLVGQGDEVHVLIEPDDDIWRLHEYFYKVDIHRVSLLEADTVKSVLQSISPNLIFNTGGYGKRLYQKDIKKIYEYNFHGIVNLLEACKKVGFESFVTAGTCEEYGFRSGYIREEETTSPLTHYGVSKVASTAYCIREAQVTGLPIYVVRPFCVFGDYESRSKLLGAVFASVFRHVPVLLLSPQATRDFVYINDVVDMFISVARRKPQGQNIFNCGTGISTRVIDFVGEVEKILGKSINAHWSSCAGDNNLNNSSCCADISKARKYLEWEPKYSLGEGLASAFEWFSENFHLYREGGEREFITTRF
ncbi:NAD-dependent epimerase/dehydratase family protein [Candidatus Dependentiae bacterium]